MYTCKIVRVARLQAAALPENVQFYIQLHLARLALMTVCPCYKGFSMLGAVKVRLTLLKHLLGYHLPLRLPTLGGVYSNAKVMRPDRALGALLQLPPRPDGADASASADGADDSSGGSLAYVHISNLVDGDKIPADVAANFPAGTVVAAKMTGFRVMDGLASASLKKSDLAEAGPVITWDSLAAATVLDGVVAEVRACVALPLLHTQ